MAQGIFVRVLNMVTNNRLLLTNRISQIHFQIPAMNLKQDTKSMIDSLHIPEKPKKPLAPFLRFANDHRKDILKQHPDWKVTEVIKKCADDWKTVHSSIKEKYENEFKAEKEVYSNQILKYMSTLTPEMKKGLEMVRKERREGKEKRKTKKLEKDNEKPKRPPSASILYIMEQAKLKNIKYTEALVELKGQWARLTPNEQEKYKSICARNMSEYQTALKAWEKKMLNEGHDILVRTKTIKECRPTRLMKVKSE